MLITIPKYYNVDHSQKVIETNLILQGSPHACGQPSPDRSTVVHPDVLELCSNMTTLPLWRCPLHEIFASFYHEQSLNTKTARQCTNVNNGSNVGATIICEKGVGIVDDSCKACKLTYCT